MHAQPHIIGPLPVHPASRRLSGAALAGLVQITLIYALILGLNHFEPLPNVPRTQIYMLDPPKHPTTPPPPVPTIQVKEVVVPPPDITIQTPHPASPPRTITVPPPEPAQEIAAQSISALNTKPPYPDLSRRLGETGMILLRLTIGTDGQVTEVAVEKSSGFPRLDEAAANHIKTHWRYRAAT